MRISTEEPSLNVFRFIGSTSRWEDNVMRGLLTIVTRSAAGGLLLREFLQACIRHTMSDSVSQSIRGQFADAVINIENVAISTQVADYSKEAKPGRQFAVLVGLTPSHATSELQDLPSELRDGDSQGRLDAVIECGTNDGRFFDVVIESKLYGSVSSEQWNRYLNLLGPDQCIQVNLSWNAVADIIENLPVACHSDPLVADYLEYLMDMYWLVGFRGFRIDDFHDNDEARASRRWKLRQLAAAVDQREEEIVDHREVRGGLDVDFYVEDQFRLLGNTGVAAWSHQDLVLKLVIGAFTYNGNERTRTLIQSKTGLLGPLFPSFWATRALLACDCAAIASAVDSMVRVGKDMMQAVVFFRLWYHRFKDVWVATEELPLRAAADWTRVDAALRAGEPPATTYATCQSLMNLRQFVGHGEQRQLDAIEAELRSGMNKPPTHHAYLMLVQKLSSDDIVQSTPASVIDGVSKLHREMLNLLRNLSAIASRKHVSE